MFGATVDKGLIVFQVIGTLHELDGERQWVHESVEAETIKSSVLRHQLKNFPRETEWEIAAAVKVKVLSLS